MLNKNGFTLIETLNYLLDWGRLCIPNPDDTNNRRWKDAPLWEQARGLVKDYSDGVVDWAISRHGKEFHGISDAYVKFIGGAISGAIARFGIDKENPNLYDMVDGLGKHGHKIETINKTAKKKREIYSRL